MMSEKSNNIESTLNRMDATTLHTQLKNIFREKIKSGEWAPNAMIPSENRLSETYGVSRMTVRGVISQFVSQGYMYRIQGKGTFVSDTKMEISSLEYSGIRGQLEARGHSVETKLISFAKVFADENDAEKLKIRPGEEIYIIKRLRLVGGEAVSYHESMVPVKLCPGLEKKDLEHEQLCGIMNRDYMLSRGCVVETLEAYSADREKAKYFNVKPRFTLLLLRDQLFTGDGILYEYSKVYFRGDKMKVKIEYRD